eukprot:8654078-Prorocentrum_lima.AAC.1
MPAQERLPSATRRQMAGQAMGRAIDLTGQSTGSEASSKGQCTGTTRSKDAREAALEGNQHG